MMYYILQFVGPCVLVISLKIVNFVKLLGDWSLGIKAAVVEQVSMVIGSVPDTNIISVYK